MMNMSNNSRRKSRKFNKTKIRILKDIKKTFNRISSRRKYTKEKRSHLKIRIILNNSRKERIRKAKRIKSINLTKLFSLK